MDRHIKHLSFGLEYVSHAAGGNRTSWEKTWFQDTDVWRQKVDFHSDKKVRNLNLSFVNKYTIS